MSKAITKRPKQKVTFKSSNYQIVKRISEVIDFLLDGLTKHEIVRYASEKWRVGERQTETYLARANVKIEEIATKAQEGAFDKIRARLERQYRRAVQAGDGQLARLLILDMRRLYALDKAPKAPIDEDGNAVPPELKQTINVLAILNREAPEAFNKFVEVTTVPRTNGKTKKRRLPAKTKTKIRKQKNGTEKH